MNNAAGIIQALPAGDLSHTSDYCCLDNIVTARAGQLMAKDGGLKASLFDQAMTGPALTCSLRGLRADSGALEKARVATEEAIRDARARFDAAAGTPMKWGRGAKPAPAQLCTLLYDRFKVRVRLSDRDSPSVAKDKLADILEDPKTPEAALPCVEIAMELSGLEEDRKALHNPLSPDGRIHCSFLVAAQISGRWCLPGWCEVLTKSGWVTLSDWNPTDEIMVWDPIGSSCRWEASKKHVFDNDESLLLLEGGQQHKFRLVCTKEHRIPTHNRKGELVAKRAGEGGELRRIPLAGNLSGVKFVDPIRTRISVMTHADGCMVMRGTIRFHFERTRKIDRCTELLEKAGLEFEITKPPSGTTTIYVKNAPGWMKLSKWFGPWLLNHDPEVFVDELRYWDGYELKPGYTVYSSTDREAAEWAVTMSHLCGRPASLSLRRKRNLGIKKNWHDSFEVNISRGTEKANCGKKNISEFNGVVPRVYCAETSTGFFMVRCNDSISVTGNSGRKNAFNGGLALYGASDPIRGIVIPDPGFIIVGMDQMQGESRLMSYLVGSKWWQQIHDEGNVHVEVGKILLPKIAHLITKSWAKSTDYPGRPGKDYYIMMKSMAHAADYCQTYRGLARQLHIKESEAKDAMENYFRKIPELRNYHRWVAEEIKTKRRLVSPLGRVRQFLGRVWESSVIREAVSWQPQSGVSDLTKVFLYRLWKHLDGLDLQVLFEHHDACYFQVRESKLDEVMPRVLALSKIEIPIGESVMAVRWEVKGGESWLNLHDFDPVKLASWESA